MNDFCVEDATNLATATRAARYTHYQGATHAYLDRICVSVELAPPCIDYSVDAVSFSDHCLVPSVLEAKNSGKQSLTGILGK